MAILGLVILSFVFAGVGGYITSSSDIAAAEVNGEEISQAALERAFQNERGRMEAQFGEAFAALAADPTYLNNFRNNILDQLIGNKLLEQAASDLGLRVSDQQIRETIVEMPEFQLGGTFNNDRFQAVLRQAGYQVNTFRDYMRTEMTRQQVAAALAGSEFTLPSEAQEIFKLQQQTRNLRLVTVPADSFKAGLEIAEDEIATFYEANLSDFDTEEQVAVEYVELMVSDLLPETEVTEADLLEYYEQAKGNYQTEEQRRVSHILVEFGEDKAAAEAQTEALLARVSGGEDFAAVAQEASADTFSAENGGDLEWISRGDFDPAFEDAMFALANVGDVTSVVESASGFHIIKLTDLRAEQTTPFEEVRTDIETLVKTDKATETFFELQQRMAEVAFEVPDSLQDVAAELNKEVQSTALFTRDTAPAPVSGAALASAFDTALIEDRVNSDVIEIANDHILVLRVAQHEPERTKAVDEVSDGIRERLLADKAQQEATTWAEARMAELQGGQDITNSLQERFLAWESRADVQRFGSADVDRAVAESAFTLATGDGKNTAVVATNSGDVALVQLTAINEGAAAEEQQLTAIKQRIEAGRSQLLMSDVIAALKAKADITYIAN